MSARTAAAWGVHLYTALSAPLGVWALFAAFAGDFKTAWVVLAATVFIDSTDGMLARAVRVSEALPTIDGRRLDDIVDYFCWVLVPMVILVQADRLPWWASIAPMLASGYGFSQTQAKTDDDYFLGFPSYWSIAALYMYVLDGSVVTNVAWTTALAILVFVPIRYPYPTKTRPLLGLTLTLSWLWGAAVAVLLAMLPNAPHWLAWASMSYLVYYAGLTGWLWRRRQAR
jgi:phosphatidylcholine synthase